MYSYVHRWYYRIYSYKIYLISIYFYIYISIDRNTESPIKRLSRLLSPKPIFRTNLLYPLTEM